MESTTITQTITQSGLTPTAFLTLTTTTLTTWAAAITTHLYTQRATPHYAQHLAHQLGYTTHETNNPTRPHHHIPTLLYTYTATYYTLAILGITQTHLNPFTGTHATLFYTTHLTTITIQTIITTITLIHYQETKQLTQNPTTNKTTQKRNAHTLQNNHNLTRLLLTLGATATLALHLPNTHHTTPPTHYTINGTIKTNTQNKTSHGNPTRTITLQDTRTQHTLTLNQEHDYHNYTKQPGEPTGDLYCTSSDPTKLENLTCTTQEPENYTGNIRYNKTTKTIQN